MIPGNTSFTENIHNAPDEETVCYCAGITKGDILRVRTDGARTLADVKADTGACTQGRCRETNPRRR